MRSHAIFHHTLLEASGNEMLRALDGVVEEAAAALRDEQADEPTG